MGMTFLMDLEGPLTAQQHKEALHTLADNHHVTGVRTFHANPLSEGAHVRRVQKLEDVALMLRNGRSQQRLGRFRHRCPIRHLQRVD